MAGGAEDIQATVFTPVAFGEWQVFYDRYAMFIVGWGELETGKGQLDHSVFMILLIDMSLLLIPEHS